MTTIDDLIAEATASGGSERANYQLFVTGLCDVLGVARPAMSQEANARNADLFGSEANSRVSHVGHDPMAASDPIADVDADSQDPKVCIALPQAICSVRSLPLDE